MFKPVPDIKFSGGTDSIPIFLAQERAPDPTRKLQNKNIIYYIMSIYLSKLVQNHVKLEKNLGGTLPCPISTF